MNIKLILNLSLRRELWGFRRWHWGSASLNFASKCFRTLTATKGEPRRLDNDYEEVCLLWWNSVDAQEIFTLPDFSVWFLQAIFRDSCLATCIVWHWVWHCRPAYNSTARPSSLNFHVCQTFIFIFCKTNVYRGVHRVLVGKPEGKRPLGRPRHRWKDNIMMDLQEVGGGGGDWMELAQDRDRWRPLVGTVRNFRVP
jgi:hypothetical protein